MAEVDEWLRDFDGAMTIRDIEGAVDLFNVDGYWRDLVAFTWNIITVQGLSEIASLIKGTVKHIDPVGWTREGNVVKEDSDTIAAWFSFQTSVGACKGHLRLKNGKCWTLFTSITELTGHPQKIGRNRPKYNQLQETENSLGYQIQPYCVIIGGGQAGITLGARLKLLGVPSIIVEKNATPGDSWRLRYKSLCLHDPVWYDHLPYLPYPSNWPVFASKDKMGDWLEMYTQVMELCYWSSSECVGAEFDEASREWMVKVMRKSGEGKEADQAEVIILRAKQLVIATGLSGFPNVPQIPGMQMFKGDIHHSSSHTDSSIYKDKKAIVVGSNNSAHDIAADLWANGADEVTMIQRSTTHVCKSEFILGLLGDLYSESAAENGVSTEQADMMFASIPYKLLPGYHIPKVAALKATDAEFYEQLQKRGFMLDFGADGSGMFMKYLRRGSGYYIDVGASQMIIDGKIKMKSGEGMRIRSMKENTVLMSDGSEMDADVIVFATGYSGMNKWTEKLISEDVAKKVGECWGLGSGTDKDPGPWEGELRNMWKPTRQDGLWFHGGNLHQARHYSLYLAIQITARFKNIQIHVHSST